MIPNLEITTVVGCRMRCSYCPQPLLVSKYAERGERMSLEMFKACLDRVPAQVEILFAGMAEPWLNPSCTDMLLHASGRGHHVGVYTTCSGMSVADAQRLQDLSFLHFCIHLPDADGQMKLKVTEDYLKAVQTCMAIPNHNLVVYGRLHPEVRQAIGRDLPDSSAALISRAGNVPRLTIQRKEGKLKCSVCGPRLNHNVLLPNGDVTLCCMDYGLDHILGNLSRQSYESLFEGDAYLTVMRGLSDESVDTRCRHCEVSAPA